MTVKHSDFTYVSANGQTKIHAEVWEPEEVRGVVQIAHGVGEYGARYAPFAEFLCQNGYLVTANDHLGHGHSVMENCPEMYFGEEDGWMTVVKDMETLRKITAEKYPGKPYFLFGHSMGSFLTRTHMIIYPGACTGYVLCGTGHPPRLLLKLGKPVLRQQSRKYGKKTYRKQIDNLVFGGFNKKIRQAETPNDWLSVNKENVKRYMADPLIYTKTTLGMFGDLLDGLAIITDPESMKKMDRSRPILLIAGEEDPVGNMGRDVKKVYGLFRSLGVEDVQMKLYPGMRHEILNETDAELPFGDVLSWLNAHML